MNKHNISTGVPGVTPVAGWGKAVKYMSKENDLSGRWFSETP